MCLACIFRKSPNMNDRQTIRRHKIAVFEVNSFTDVQIGFGYQE